MTDAPLIVLLGIDGSGKSTVAESVAERLREHYGLRADVFWARWQPGFLAGVRAIVRRLFLRRSTYSHGKEEPADVSRLKASAFGRWRLVGLAYVFTALLDYRAQYAKRIKSSRRQTDVLLLDRYWYDLVIDAVGNNEGGVRAADLVRWSWSRLFPRPSAVILLDLDEEIAQERKGGENPLDYLIRRRAIYRDVAATVGATTVDAGRALSEVVEATASVVLAASTHA